MGVFAFPFFFNKNHWSMSSFQLIHVHPKQLNYDILSEDVALVILF